MSFASRLREQRIQMNLTQAELAEALGVTKGAVGHYEAGLNSPKAEVLFKVFKSEIAQNELKPCCQKAELSLDAFPSCLPADNA